MSAERSRAIWPSSGSMASGLAWTSSFSRSSSTRRAMRCSSAGMRSAGSGSEVQPESTQRLRKRTRMRMALMALVRELDQPGSAHAAADAHRHHAVFGLAPLTFEQDVAGHARARHAIGMADGDRAAIDVHAIVRDAEPVGAIDHLRREGLV